MTVDKAALRELLEKATPGPWSTYVRRGAAISVGASHNCTVATIAVPPVGYHVANAHLIAAARESLPALLAEIDALRAELQARQWQPIETAPKDGTEILAWRDDCGQFIASYTSPSAFPLTQDELDQTDEETLFAKDWFTQWPQALRLEGSECPTAWMPLPPAPPQGDGAC